MTQRDDLDRLLGDWLSEGPARTPEPVLATAVQHARSHPRRPDPLSFLRRDPMAGRASLFGVAPVPVFAALGLLLVAALGVAVVGGQRGDVPPVDPGPTVGPSTDASARPSSSPIELPDPSFPIRVGLQTGTSAAMVVEVTDASGLLVDARTGTPADGGSVPGGTVSATNIDERTVLLTWTDAVCDIVYDLRIETTISMTLTSPPCEGDTLALDRRLLLQFVVPVDASVVDVQLLAPPAPASPVAELPAIATAEVPGGTSPMTVTLRGDPSVVTGIRAATPGEVEAAAPSERPRADLVAYAAARPSSALAWTGGACDVSATLTVPTQIDPARGGSHGPRATRVAMGRGDLHSFVEPVDPAARELTFVRAAPTP